MPPFKLGFTRIFLSYGCVYTQGFAVVRRLCLLCQLRGCVTIVVVVVVGIVWCIWAVITKALSHHQAAATHEWCITRHSQTKSSCKRKYWGEEPRKTNTVKNGISTSDEDYWVSAYTRRVVVLNAVAFCVAFCWLLVYNKVKILVMLK